MPEHGSIWGHREIRPARADDYEEPLRGTIERAEIEPPDEYVVEEWIPRSSVQVVPPGFGRLPAGEDDA